MKEMKDSVHADGKKWQYNKRGETLKEYLDPFRPDIGLNPDFKQEKRTHVQPHEKDLTTAPHMNNNKLSDKKRTPDHLLSCKLSHSGKAPV